MANASATSAPDPEYGGSKTPPVPPQGPESFTPELGTPDRDGIARTRRTVHVSSLAELVLALPWFVFSLMVVGIVAGAIDAGVTAPVMGSEPSNFGATLILLAWFGSGAVMFWPRGEAMVARVLMGLRRPGAADQAKLDAAWRSVAARAGIDGTAYSLWVEESDEINAFAGAGHIVAVTRRTLDTMPPQLLEAVLAHELGHHIGGHSWASALAYWYSIPARGMLRLGRLAFRILAAGYAAVYRIVSKLFPQHRLMTVLLGAALLLGCACYAAFFLALLLAPLLVTTPVLAWFSRRSEKYADEVAVRLGYGPALIEVFRHWLTEGQDIERARAGALTQMLANHPSVNDRLHAVEEQLRCGS